MHSGTACGQMASLEEVQNLKRDELGLFLRDRGIPYSSRNKGDRLTLAINALEQDIPLTPSVKQDLSTAEEEIRQILTLENGMIRLPHPSKMTAGWTISFEDFPDTTRVEVMSYLSKRKMF